MSNRKGYCRRSAYRRIVRRDGERCKACCDRPEYWFDLALVELDDGSLYTPIARYVALDLDHVVPIIDGGRHVDANFQLLCRPCHHIKTIAENAARRAVA